MVWAIAKVWRYSQSMPLSIITIRQSMDFQFEGKTDTLKQRPPFNCPLLADFQGHKDARLFIHKDRRNSAACGIPSSRKAWLSECIWTSDPYATKSWNFHSSRFSSALITIMASSPNWWKREKKKDSLRSAVVKNQNYIPMFCELSATKPCRLSQQTLCSLPAWLRVMLIVTDVSLMVSTRVTGFGQVRKKKKMS